MEELKENLIRVKKKLLDQLEIETLKNWINQGASLTLKKLKEKLFTEYNKCVSIKTIDNYITKFNYSFKRISLIP